MPMAYSKKSESVRSLLSTVLAFWPAAIIAALKSTACRLPNVSANVGFFPVIPRPLARAEATAALIFEAIKCAVSAHLVPRLTR